MALNSSCFWSLLSLDEMKFIYIPSSVSDIKVCGHSLGSLLLHHSLYEFMHPNEIALAKFDLSSFMKLNNLAGSVTRCRLLSFQSIAEVLSHPHRRNMPLDYLTHSNTANLSWNILDLVVYTATNDTVLVFFHSTGIQLDHVKTDYTKTFELGCCQGYNNFITHDAMQLNNVLKQEGKDRTTILPLRIFQIVDQRKGTPLFIWPPSIKHQSTNIIELVQTISKDMILKEFKSSSFDDKQQDDISCTRHFYATTKIIFIKESCLLQRILIPYGNIFFESFQVSPVLNKPSSIPYQHYYMDPHIGSSSTINNKSAATTNALIIGGKR